MATPSRHGSVLGAAAIICFISPFATAIGVNYGTKGDNLPPPAMVAAFLANRTLIDRVKLFDNSPDMVRAFAGTGISVMVTAANGDIPSLASKEGATAWVAANVAPYYPATAISLVAVGNEIMDTHDQNLIGNLVPAMRTLKAALVAAGYGGIRVSTPSSLGILVDSEPPSAARFRDGWDVDVFAPMLEFLRNASSPLVVNAYPYFGYNGDTLPYALARPNPGVLDAGTGITYRSMLEAQLDSVYSAMKKLGFEDVEILIGETGWPTKAMDGQVGVSPAEAAEYNRYLIGKIGSGSGTPLMPGRAFETYIFALFNEDLKPGPVAERNFGMFQPDFTPMYDVGIMVPAAAPMAAATHDSAVAAPMEEEKGPSSTTTASPPVPEGASSGSPSTNKTPEEEAGRGKPPSEAAAKGQGGDDGQGNSEKTKPQEGGATQPTPAGAASEAARFLLPFSWVLVAIALPLAVHV